MVIKKTSSGYEKGSKYEVNKNLKSNFHLPQESNITQVKRRVNKFGFKVENLNSKGNRKGENIFMFLETPDNQNKVIPNTFEYDVTKINPNKKIDYSLLLKIMNGIIDPSTGKLANFEISKKLGISHSLYNKYIVFLKQINFITPEKNTNFHWKVEKKDYIIRPANPDDYIPFYKTMKEEKNFDKVFEDLGYFCYHTVLYGVNKNHELFKYCSLGKATEEFIEKVKEFDKEFDFEEK